MAGGSFTELFLPEHDYFPDSWAPVRWKRNSFTFLLRMQLLHMLV
jgi:hypothetical protein